MGMRKSTGREVDEIEDPKDKEGICRDSERRS
jgi:hypothetical protein